MTFEQLPPGWTLATVADVSESVVVGFVGPSTQHYESDGVLFLMGKDVREGRLVVDRAERISREFHLRERKSQLFPGDVVVVRIGKSGTAAVVPESIKEANCGGLVIVKQPRALLANYLATYLNSPSGQSEANAQVRGVTRRTLNTGSVASAIVPVPPMSEQHRILAKVEGLTARNRRAREALDAVPPLLDQLRQSILAAAFRGDLTAGWRANNPNVEPADKLLARIRAERRKKWEETELAKLKAKCKAPTDDKWKAKYTEPEPVDTTGLPELPAGWCWASVDQILSGLRNGISATPDQDTGLRILRISAVRPLRVDVDDVRFLTPTDEYSDYVLADGDLLLTRYNGNPELVGVAGVGRGFREPTVYPDKLIRATPVESVVSSDFLALALNTGLTRRHIGEKGKSAAGQVGVSGADIKGAPVPVPPRGEQEVLVRAVNALLIRTDVARATVAESGLTLSKLDSAVLAKAFRGELVPQDPNDEPASVLLERIRAARDSERGEASRAPRRARSAERVSEPSGDNDNESEVPPRRPDPGKTVSKDLSEEDPESFRDEVFSALWTLGPLEKDAAVRRVADHLRQSGHVDFQRLRADGPLFAQVLDAIESAVKIGRLDRPKRGYVRACSTDAATYTVDDWRHALVASLGIEPTDREEAIRTAAQWARDNLGLEFTRLRGDGYIVEGLRSAINSAIRRGDVIRHDATQISRASAAQPSLLLQGRSA